MLKLFYTVTCSVLACYCCLQGQYNRGCWRPPRLPVLYRGSADVALPVRRRPTDTTTGRPKLGFPGVLCCQILPHRHQDLPGVEYCIKSGLEQGVGQCPAWSGGYIETSSVPRQEAVTDKTWDMRGVIRGAGDVVFRIRERPSVQFYRAGWSGLRSSTDIQATSHGGHARSVYNKVKEINDLICGYLKKLLCHSCSAKTWCHIWA